jgi:hypothetical protein
MLKQRVVPKIRSGQGARVTAEPVPILSSTFVIFRGVSLSCKPLGKLTDLNVEWVF